MKTYLSALSLGLLACGCSLVSSLDGYSFDGETLDGGRRTDGEITPGDSGRRLDASTDADVPPPDSGIDGGMDACGGCGGERPVCDRGTMTCVECLESADCASGVCASSQCHTVTRYSLGLNHTCALLEDASVWCWGQNEFGQVGDGTRAIALRPTRVVGLADTVDIAAGFDWTCARSDTHQIRCWGHNETEDGMERTLILGALDQPFSTSPVLVAEPSAAAGLIAGYGHACYLGPGREMFCWGANWAGQLGNGSFNNSAVPLRVETSAGAPVAFDRGVAGGGHTCGRDGTSISCWGYNDFGQLGTGDTTTSEFPRALSGIPAPSLVAAGDVHSCALASDGVYCWGDNPDNRVGDGTTMQRSSPVFALAGSDFAGVAGGRTHTCAWTTDGRGQCWGDGGVGQYGDGMVTTDDVPHEVMLPGIASIEAGGLHNCALTIEDEMYCWGSNDFGQLGDGGTSQRSTPVRVVWP